MNIKSDASLKVMSTLKFPYGLLSKIAILVPRFARNLVYDFVGRNRYKIWGKRDNCIIPDEERRKSFINSSNELPPELKIDCNKYFKFI